MNRNLLVLGSVALLILGGFAFFVASRKSGDTHVTKQIINNTYFQQLIASGATTREDLEALEIIRPYGDGLIGISRENFDWPGAVGFAGRAGGNLKGRPALSATR